MAKAKTTSRGRPQLLFFMKKIFYQKNEGTTLAQPLHKRFLEFHKPLVWDAHNPLHKPLLRGNEFSNERSCTTPPNPLYKPARFNTIYHVWNRLESLYCCCVFLFRMSSDFDSRDNPENQKAIPGAAQERRSSPGAAQEQPRSSQGAAQEQRRSSQEQRRSSPGHPAAAQEQRRSSAGAAQEQRRSSPGEARSSHEQPRSSPGAAGSSQTQRTAPCTIPRNSNEFKCP